MDSRSGRVGTLLILTLALLSGTAPFAIDMYLPALPAMAEDLRADAAAVQLSLGAMLAGLAIGQVVFGPVSDRWGRKIPLLFGTGAVTVAGVVTALASDVVTLNVARLFQGLGGAAGLVIGRAVVRDIAQGREAARIYSLLATMTAIAPVLAPFLGGLLVPHIGWRGIMLVVAVIGAIMFFSCLIIVPETRPKELRASVGPGHILASFSLLLRCRSFALRLGVVLLSFGSFMTYVASSSYVYQNTFGFTPSTFGLVFAVNALGLAAGSLLAGALIVRFSLHRVVQAGLCLAVLGAAGGLLVVLLSNKEWLLFTICVFLAMSGFGVAYGSSTAMAMDRSGVDAGSASALIGFAQFGVAGALAVLVGAWSENTPVPMAVSMLILSAAALLVRIIDGHVERHDELRLGKQQAKQASVHKNQPAIGASFDAPHRSLDGKSRRIT